MAAEYNVGIIGCGLIGNKRAEALKGFDNSRLVAVADVDLDRAKKLAKEHGCDYSKDSKDITQREDINLVIISTSNDALARVTKDAIRSGKHVLVEKPAARNPKELTGVIREYEKSGRVMMKVGFNHRFHPAVEKAKWIVNNEDIGDIMFIRGRYGHGGRPGYEREWRGRRETAGGGEMLDQGSHLVDLSRYFMGDISSAIGLCRTYFWDIDVEDNCFALLRTKKGQIAQLHASWTQWKNAFSLELFYRRGQLSIDGLGGSYGTETLTYYRMRPQMGPPDKFVFEWDGPDESWRKEYGCFLDSIESGEEPNGSIYDALKSLKAVSSIYAFSRRFSEHGPRARR